MELDPRKRDPFYAFLYGIQLLFLHPEASKKLATLLKAYNPKVSKNMDG